MEIDREKVLKILQEIKSVHLVVATKYLNVQQLYELEELGVKIFGENRVPSLLEKYEQYHGKGIFHMIGTLQVNKVRYIIDKVAMIHSVDSYKLIDEIDRQAKKHNLKMEILIQVNIAMEESKHGFLKEELSSVFTYLKSKENVIPKGLMIMAPHINSSDTEKYFIETENLQKELQKQFPMFNLNILSMGMSNDYEYAIKHGATHVRIGQALLKDSPK